MSWVRATSRAIPSIGSPKRTFELNDYSLGMNSFISNDKFPLRNGGTNLWRLAKNARIVTLGEYQTRKGVDFHTAPAGQTQDQAVTAVTGAADASFSQTIRLAQSFVAGTTGRCSKVELNLKNTTATGTVMVELWSDDAGTPTARLGRSSIASSAVGSSYAYLTARFVSAPTVTAGSTYWIVAYVQASGSNSYRWSSTTSATTAKISTDSGATWSATSYALNFKQHVATAGATIGLHRAYKSDGTKKTLLVQGTTLYSADDTTGALTVIKSGLSANATQYRFCTVNDTVYYVNGFDGLRKWDFTTESQVTATNYSHICEHKGMLFLATKDDANKLVFSNFAAYETFTSTDFIYVPSPKTGDPITALQSLNGYLIVATRNNKYLLTGSDNATYALDEAPDQKGTYSQETMAADKNFIYYLSDDGVYRSNGSEPQLLSTDVLSDVKGIASKDTACLAVNRGRLYLWFRVAGQDQNSECFVWNLNYGDGGGTVESRDTTSYVSRAVTAYQDSDQLLVASERVGQAYWQENDTNDYTNLGDDIDFELQTHFLTFDSPATLKQIRDWYPRFAAQSGSYAVRCEYAVDLRNSWQLVQAVNVQGAGSTFGGGAKYADGSQFGTTAETTTTIYVPGEYRRVALRYKHTATRQPHTFYGHTFVTQQRRLR